MEFKAYRKECRKEKLTWEKCTGKFACPDGEDCWFDSEDYYNDCGPGAVESHARK